MLRAYENREVELGTKIIVRLHEYDRDRETGESTPRLIRANTTVGRAILSEILPHGMPFEFINKALKKKDKVSLVGFGTFLVRERAARTGRNPKTGAVLKIKASKTPSFKAGKALKDAVK